MRFFVRLIGFLCVAAGFAALVIDAARAIANDAWAPVPFSEALTDVMPQWYAALEPAAKSLHPLLWNPLLSGLVQLPTFAVMMVFGFLLMLIARSRRERMDFSTR